MGGTPEQSTKRHGNGAGLAVSMENLRRDLQDISNILKGRLLAHISPLAKERTAVQIPVGNQEDLKQILSLMSPIERMKLFAESGTFDAFVSVAEARKMLGFKADGSVRRLAGRDEIQAVKIGREWFLLKEAVESYTPEGRGRRGRPRGSTLPA